MSKVGLSVPVSLQDLFFKPYRVILVMSLCQGRLSCKATEGRGRAEQKAGQEEGDAVPRDQAGAQMDLSCARCGSCLLCSQGSLWPACHAARSCQLCACAEGRDRLGTLS